MKVISDKALLGVAAVSVIARSKEPISSKTICDELKIPHRHLETLLQALTRSGIIKGSRGPRGGYTVHMPSESISVLTIAEIADSLSSAESSDFDSSTACRKIVPALDKVAHILRDSLSKLTVAAVS